MKKSIFRKILSALGALLSAVLLAVAVLLIYLTVTEYDPQPRQAADAIRMEEGTAADTDLTLYSWNIGYAGLGKDSDFFMDGGEMVDPPSQEAVMENLNAIGSFMLSNPADAWLLQEVDVNSSRTESMDQFQKLQTVWSGSSGFAYNYKCPFVPIPWPPMGRVESGIATLTGLETDSEMTRVSLPCPFSWPVRVAQIKRCLLVTRLPIEGSEKELVIVNLHLEAYDDGEGKIAQTNVLMELLQEEYEKGNYVIAGGDFNQTFPGGLDKYPIAEPEKWLPGVLEESTLPDGWQYAYDMATPTCRLLDAPYDGTNQHYVIDGFILSPNVQLQAVETVDLAFENADHNPVRLEVILAP